MEGKSSITEYTETGLLAMMLTNPASNQPLLPRPQAPLLESKLILSLGVSLPHPCTGKIANKRLSTNSTPHSLGELPVQHIIFNIPNIQAPPDTSVLRLKICKHMQTGLSCKCFLTVQL